MSKYTCHNSICAISISKAAFPVAMNCPVCQTPLEEKLDIIKLSPDDLALINSLPYVIAYSLKRTLLEQHPWTKINLFKDTFLNYLKYLGLLAASEFFNSDIKDKGMVALFNKNLTEKPQFGLWNDYIRNVLKFLKQKNHTFFYPELPAYYEMIETGKQVKKHKGEIQYQDGNGVTQIIVQTSITSIGMLINFRNRYLGHGLTLDAEKSEKLWNEYFPIFRHLLEQLSFTKDYPMLKREHGETYLLHTAEIKTIESISKTTSNIWIENKEGHSFDILPFFIVPAEVSLGKEDKEQMLTYESYTGKTIKFFSPEGSEKLTSGKMLEKLNHLLRDKQIETPFTPEAFTKEEFLNRINEENILLLDSLINEKKIIPGVYQHREEMEIKLREWIGARASIFFIVAEAGSGKTNLLAEMQRQYAELQLPSLIIRAGRMEKQSLKQQLAYLLNIDLAKGLKNSTSIAGTQTQPTFILIDGLNEANNAEEIWQEIIELSKVFEPGSLKFVVTNRANTKSELDRYLVSEKNQKLLYGENKDNETGLSAYSFWLTALNMKEMKGAWDTYVAKDKSRFKPKFSFDDIATFDRALYNQINNPLILRIFLEIYNGKSFPKNSIKHLNIWQVWFKSFSKNDAKQLHIWQDWLNTFSNEEQNFLKLLADEVWLNGGNELLQDDLLKNDALKPYFTSDIINAPYNRLKNMGWISRYVKDLNGYVGFTVEYALLYLLGIKLMHQVPEINIEYINSILQKESKLQKSAIESFLCELAINENLELVANLIDAGNENTDLCIKPLLIYLKTFGVNSTLEKVLETPTKNDWKALLELDYQLENLQLHVLRKEFLIEAMKVNLLNQKDDILLGLRAIAILDKELALLFMSRIDTTKSFIKKDADLLFQLGNCEQKFGEYDKALTYLEKGLTINLKTLGAEHPKVAKSYNLIGETWYNKGEFDKALEYYEKGLAIELKTLAGDRPAVAHFNINIGLTWHLKGDYDKALAYFEKGLAIYLKTLGAEHPDVASSYNNIGLAWHLKGEYDKSLEYFEKCLVIFLKTLGAEHPKVAGSYNNIGSALDNKGEYDKALDYYEISLKTRLKSLGSNHPEVATSYGNIGVTWDNKGEYDKALSYYEKCLAIRLRTLGGEHPGVADMYNSIGLVWDNKNAMDKALYYYEKSLAIRLKTLGTEHADVASSYNNIGIVWKNKGEYNKALDYFEKGLAIQLKTLGAEHADVGISYNNIGQTLDSLGENEKSRVYLEKSQDIQLKSMEIVNPNLATELIHTGNKWYKKEEYDKALTFYEKGLAIQLKTLGAEHAETAASYANIGDVWKHKGKYDKALSYYEKSLAIDPSVANPYNNIGLTWYKKEEYDKALEYYEKGLVIQIKTFGGEHTDVATSYNNIGAAWSNKGEYDKALEYYEKGLVIQIKTFGGEHPSVATSYNNIGVAWDSKAEYDKALEYYEKCLAIRLKTLGTEHADVANSYNNIGVVWSNKGEYDKALDYYEKCLAIELKTLGGEHPSVATSYNNIGLIWNKKGEYDKALEYFEKCLAIRLKTLGTEHADVANSYNNIGVAWDSKAEYDKALEYYVLSSQIRFKKLGASHNLTNKSIENAKRVAKELGKENELPDWMKNN